MNKSRAGEETADAARPLDREVVTISGRKVVRAPSRAAGRR